MASHAHRLIAGAVAIGASIATATAADGAPAGVAWLKQDALEWRALPGGAATPPVRVPLGSVWKLFVYAYLVDADRHEPIYRCASQRSGATSEDDYCCEPGQTVERDAALARSCAPYFAMARLGLDAVAWRRHWRSLPGDASWLADLSNLRPQTEVAPRQLLVALASLSPQARRHARSALLDVLLEGYGRQAWLEMGSGLRYKTYSWHDRQGHSIGGGAGWLADGTPVWFVGPGASRNVLERQGAAIASLLPATGGDDDDSAQPCVEVDFFRRYPIRTLRDARGQPVEAGPLATPTRVEFANGVGLDINGAGAIEVQRVDGHARVRGRFALDTYVARVIDREADAQQPQAAYALAIAARSYALQEGRYAQGCWQIADDSRWQRVSPNPPSAAALQAARYTHDVVLAMPVRYHRDKSAPQLLSWQKAKQLAQSGMRFDAILADAFGAASFASWQGARECDALDEARLWLKSRAPVWMRNLRRHAGFEAPEAVEVCRLESGNPYSDQGRNRIYVRDWMSAQGRLTLAHEYAHLAFRHHPRGNDEEFIETLARRMESGEQP